MLEFPVPLKITFIWVFFCILNDIILSSTLYCDVGKCYFDIWKFFTAVTLLLHLGVNLYVISKVGKLIL